MKLRRSLYARPVIIRGEQCSRTGRLIDSLAPSEPVWGHPRCPKRHLAQRLRWSVWVWSPPPESNRRPHILTIDARAVHDAGPHLTLLHNRAVRDALRMRGVGWHEVACSAVSGKFLAWRGPVAHGARFGSHALYVKDNRLHYVYDFVGSLQQKVAATQDIPPGRTSSCRHRSTSRVRTPRASRPGSCRCITATTRSARHTSRPSPASCHRRGRAVRRPRQRLGRHRRLPGPAALALHRRHHQAARRRCQRRALHGPRARGRRHAAPGVDGTAGGRPRFPPNDVARARVMATLIQATRRVVAGPQGRP
jgi:hypothetical protein